jgi:hypothetical protein
VTFPASQGGDRARASQVYGSTVRHDAYGWLLPAPSASMPSRHTGASTTDRGTGIDLEPVAEATVTQRYAGIELEPRPAATVTQRNAGAEEITRIDAAGGVTVRSWVLRWWLAITVRRRKP